MVLSVLHSQQQGLKSDCWSTFVPAFGMVGALDLAKLIASSFAVGLGVLFVLGYFLQC